VSVELHFNASQIALQPSTPMWFHARLMLVSVELFFSTSRITLAPSTPMYLVGTLMLVRVELVFNASPIAGRVPLLTPRPPRSKLNLLGLQCTFNRSARASMRTRPVRAFPASGAVAALAASADQESTSRHLFCISASTCLLMSLPSRLMLVSVELLFNASPIAFPPSPPMPLPSRLMLLSVELVFNASPIALPPSTPIWLLSRLMLVSVELHFNASQIALQPSTPMWFHARLMLVSVELFFSTSRITCPPSSRMSRMMLVRVELVFKASPITSHRTQDAPVTGPISSSLTVSFDASAFPNFSASSRPTSNFRSLSTLSFS